MGPNSAVGSGSLLVIIEREVEYAAAAIAKMQRERIRTIEVKAEAVRDFDEYLEVHRTCFPHSVEVADSVLRQHYFPTVPRAH